MTELAFCFSHISRAMYQILISHLARFSLMAIRTFVARALDMRIRMAVPRRITVVTCPFACSNENTTDSGSKKAKNGKRLGEASREYQILAKLRTKRSSIVHHLRRMFLLTTDQMPPPSSAGRHEEGRTLQTRGKLGRF